MTLPYCGLRANAPGNLFLVVLEYADPVAGDALTRRFYYEFSERAERRWGMPLHAFTRVSTKVQARLANVAARIPELQALYNRQSIQGAQQHPSERTRYSRRSDKRSDKHLLEKKKGITVARNPLRFREPTPRIELGTY